MADERDGGGGRFFGDAIWIFVGMAGLACALTVLFLSMRAVMRIGGTCASGGPFEIRSPCPKGIPLLMIGSIWGGLVCAGVYAWRSIRAGSPNLVGLAWPALFISLGYNFLAFGINPPGGAGLVWGWLVCGVVFVLMGAIPLVVVLTSGRSVVGASFGMPGGAAANLARLGARMSPSSGTRGDASAPAIDDAANPDDVVQRLQHLAELHRSGDLTSEEYEAAKRAVLELEGQG